MVRLWSGGSARTAVVAVTVALVAAGAVNADAAVDKGGPEVLSDPESWCPPTKVDDCPDDRIAFVSDATGNYDVYTMTLNGGGVVDLTPDNPAFDVSPAWSRDRTQIAFSSRRGGNRDIYVMNADGSGLRRVTTDPGVDDFPAWSPDGRRIVYSNLTFDTAGAPVLQLYTTRADGFGGVQQLTNDAKFVDTRPAYAPDGQRIAFNRLKNPGPTLEVPPGNAIWIMHADGSHLQQLTPSDLEADSPSWSPDGSRIAFHNNSCPTCDVSDIFTMNPAGRQLRRLTNGIGNNLFPTWSRDGSRILFQNTPDLQSFFHDIWIMRTDGSHPANLTNSPSVDDVLRDI